MTDLREERSQILKLYTRITKSIAEEVIVELSAVEKRWLRRIKSIDKEALDA